MIFREIEDFGATDNIKVQPKQSRSFNPNAGATMGGFGGIGGLNVFGFHASLPRIKRRQPKPDVRLSVTKMEGEKDDHEPKEKEQKLDPGAVFSYVYSSFYH